MLRSPWFYVLIVFVLLFRVFDSKVHLWKIQDTVNALIMFVDNVTWRISCVRFKYYLKKLYRIIGQSWIKI